MNELFAHHTKHHVEHHQKHTTPTVKPTGDSILLCGGFSVASPGWLVTVQGGANAEKSWRKYAAMIVYFTAR